MKFLLKTILFISLVLPFSYAEKGNEVEPIDEAAQVVFDTSDEWFATQEKWFAEQQTSFETTQLELEEIQAGLPAEEQKLQEDTANLETIEEISEEMINQAVAQRKSANEQTEILRLKRVEVQAKLAEQKDYLNILQEKLKELTKFPREELTVAHNQQIDLFMQATAMQERNTLLQEKNYSLLKQQSKFAVNQEVNKITLHIKLKDLPEQRRIKERKEMLVNAQTASDNFEKTLLAREQELPNKISSLKTAKEEIDKLKQMLEAATLTKNTTDVNVKNSTLEAQGIESNLERQKKSIVKQEEKLEQLKKTPPIEEEQVILQEKRIIEFDNHLNLQKQKLDLETQNLEILKKLIELNKKSLQLDITWYDNLQVILNVRQEEELENQIQAEQQKYLEQAAEIRWQLIKLPVSDDSAIHKELLNIQIQEANEMAQHVLRKLSFRYTKEKLVQWQTATEKQETADVSQEQLEHSKLLIAQAQVLIDDLNKLQTSLQDKLAVLKQQQQVIEMASVNLTGQNLKYNQQAQKIINQLKVLLQQEFDQIPVLLTQGKGLLVLLEKAYANNLSSALWRERRLPATITEWKNLSNEAKNLPTFLQQRAELTWQGFTQAIQQTKTQQLFILAAISIIWLIFVIAISFWFRRIRIGLVNIAERTNFSDQLLLSLQLWSKNIISIMIVGLLSWLILMTKPTAFSISIAIIVLVVLLGSKLLINLSWLLLSQLEPPRIKLYQQIRWLLPIFALLILFVALLHVEEESLVKISFTLQDVIDSVFMFLLSLAALPLFKIRKIILTTLKKNIQGYWLITISFITLLIPLSVLVVSILGVIGYISLGWIVAKQFSLFLLILTGWLIASGLLTDIMNWWRAFSLKGKKTSVFAEDIIPLIEKLSGLGLIALAIMALFWITGWDSDVAVKENIRQVLTYPLISFGDSGGISLGNLLLAALLLWIVFWLGGWTRQISYRWVFGNISDQGVRHSLSTFIQYAVVILGLVVVLKTIGIDPTALTVFAGALGVGIGFGMRDVVNNFISGILLLVERPMRTGDSLDVWNNRELHKEVKVIQIGIRSTIVRLKNLKELVLPNSEFISKPFINWTRTDNILRITSYIGVSYDSDLAVAKEIIENIMEESSRILDKPAYRVIVWEFEDFRISLRYDYFADVTQGSLDNIRGEMNFNIWNRFKKAGIKIPYPKRDINFTSTNKDFVEELPFNR